MRCRSLCKRNWGNGFIIYQQTVLRFAPKDFPNHAMSAIYRTRCYILYHFLGSLLLVLGCVSSAVITVLYRQQCQHPAKSKELKAAEVQGVVPGAIFTHSQFELSQLYFKILFIFVILFEAFKEKH